MGSISKGADDGGSQSPVSPEEVENGGSQSSVFPEEADNEDNTRGGGGGGGGGGGRGDGILKKGTWTSAEDAILVEYVQKYGDRNWSAVQKKFGLARCGKSCRLRWTNHLRPDLRKGAFTAEEENLLVEQHYILRNKWAQIALALPGRTDNEIKNYWHTRSKRLKKAGLPIYPEEVVERAKNMNQEHLNVDVGADQGDDDNSQIENFEIPEVVFKSFKLRPEAIVLPPYLDMQGSGSVDQSIDSVYNILLGPPSKRARLEDTTFNALDNTTFNNNSDSYTVAIPIFDQCEKYCMLSPPSDTILCASNGYDDNLIIGSHAALNDNISPFQSDGSMMNELNIDRHVALNDTVYSSEPIDGCTSNELPSIQYLQTQQCSLDTPVSRFPIHESVDTSIQFPPIEDPNQSVFVYPASGDLLNTRSLQDNSNDTNLQEGIEKSAPKSVAYDDICADWDESSAPLLYSDYYSIDISMFSIDEPYFKPFS